MVLGRSCIRNSRPILSPLKYSKPITQITSTNTGGLLQPHRLILHPPQGCHGQGLGPHRAAPEPRTVRHQSPSIGLSVPIVPGHSTLKILNTNHRPTNAIVSASFAAHTQYQAPPTQHDCFCMFSPHTLNTKHTAPAPNTMYSAYFFLFIYTRRIVELIRAHLKHEFGKRRSPNDLFIEVKKASTLPAVVMSDA